MASANILNVLTYGAKGNGSQDDTKAIQAAINASYTNGGVVYFPAGVYVTSQPLLISANTKLMGDSYKGTADNGDERGAEILYTGSDAILKTNRTDGDGIIYGLGIEDLRFNATAKPAYALFLHNISEAFLHRVHINGGFKVGLYTDYYDIGTISESIFTECDIGMWIDSKVTYTAVESLNVTGCNFWKCSTAIKANNLEGVNFFGNHIEYFNIAFHLINDQPDKMTGGMFTSISITGNNIYSSNPTAYPDPRVLKIESTTPTNVFTLEELTFAENRTYCKNARYLIEIALAKNTSSIKHLKTMHIVRNVFWGCKVSAIYSDIAYADFILENNDVQDGFMSGVTVPEFSGVGAISGIESSMGRNQVKGSLQLPAAPSSANAAGEIWFPAGGSKPKIQTPSGTRDVMLIEAGSTAVRPSQLVTTGQTYFDQTLGKFLVWNGSSWQDTVHSLFTEKLIVVIFAGNSANQKADIQLLAKSDTFYGTIEMTVVSNGSGAGMIRKTFAVGMAGGTISLAKSKYTDVYANATPALALGDVGLDSANTTVKVTLANLTSSPQSAAVHIKAYPADSLSKANLDKKMTAGAVYTNDATIFPPPAISLMSTKGISATTTEAKNLRGIKVSIPRGATTAHVDFPTSEADANYGLFLSTTWATTWRITSKSASGFDVAFATSAPTGSTFDWLLVR